MNEVLSTLGRPAQAAGWKVERRVRAIAGTIVLASLALSLLHPAWLLLAAFAGLNLLQSGITGWCLMNNILSTLEQRRG